IEKDGSIVWSQPEMVLYARDPALFGMSYPDYMEQDGRFWIVETQKKEARVHEINLGLLQGLWDQGIDSSLGESGLLMSADADMLEPNRISFPPLPNLITGGGFSIELWLTVEEMEINKQILHTLGAKEKGIEISLAENRSIKIQISDGEIREADISNSTQFISDQ